jgi:hypothetical protein
MRDAPDADDLLGTARDSLLANILPVVAPAQRREILMIANAIAIARRSLAAGEAPLLAELAALRALYPQSAGEETRGLAIDDALAALNARLVRDIRRGAFDAPGCLRSTVESLLRDAVVQKLRENRPKLLGAEAH